MKSIKSLTMAIAISLLSITACKESKASEEKEQKQSPQTFSEYLGKKISRDFIGIVVDENKHPLEDVMITIGNKTTLTDSIGGFAIKAANVNVNFAFIEAKKEGYKNNATSLVPTNKIEKVNIMLEHKGSPCLFWFCKHNHSLANSNQ
jgi:hypothetical protein